MSVLNGEVMPRKISLGEFCKEQYQLKLKQQAALLEAMIVDNPDISDIEARIDKGRAEAWEHAAQSIYNIAMQQATERMANALVKKVEKN